MTTLRLRGLQTAALLAVLSCRSPAVWAAPAAGVPAEANDVASPTPAPDTSSAREPPTSAELRAGWGEGFGAQTSDGKFSMGLRARAQARTTALVPEDDVESSSVDFMIRRARLVVQASGWHDLVELQVQLGFGFLDLDPVAPAPLRDAYITISPWRDLNVRVGQMKVPFGRQRIISSGAQQMVDRSLVTGELNLDRDVGLQLFSRDLFGLGGWLGYAVGVFGGDGRNRVSGGYGLLYSARLAVRPLGGSRGDDLDEVDFDKSTRPKLAIAVSGAFNHRTDRPQSTLGPVFQTGPWADYLHAGGDVSFKWRGLSMTGEVFMRRALRDRNTAVIDGSERTDEARSGYGGFFQVGQLIGDHVEVAGRVGSLHPLGPTLAVRADKELGGGVSCYVLEHTLKLQADTFYIYETWGEGAVQARLQLQAFP